MTESIYKQTKLVQLTPAGEWYVAIPHPERPNILAVDTGKNLTFAAEFEPATLATVQPVLALNRFVDLRLEFIPGLLEGSAFNLLANALYQTISDVQQQATNPRNQLILLTLLTLQAALGQSLQQALTTPPVREETLYAEHDFIAQGLQSRLTRANWGTP
ncbi:MAG: hypothetical protein KC449_13460 [Anaerolineales bacterium]|nr:hypothetical protein [Anaerolineales bacterium]